MSLQTEPASALLRRGLLWIGALTTLGIAVDLAAERHWTQPSQFIAWGAVAVLGLAIGMMVRPTAARVRVVRFLAMAVVVAAVVGVWEHIRANYDAAPLDFRYAQSWDGLPALSRWWLAASKGVGPSPPFAPGALAQVALCVLLASVRHPALSVEQRTPDLLPGPAQDGAVNSSHKGR